MLGKDTGFSLSELPRESSYDIYRVPSSQSMEDRGYVSQKKANPLKTPTSQAASLISAILPACIHCVDWDH